MMQRLFGRVGQLAGRVAGKVVNSLNGDGKVLYDAYDYGKKGYELYDRYNKTEEILTREKNRQRYKRLPMNTNFSGAGKYDHLLRMGKLRQLPMNDRFQSMNEE